MGRWNGLWQGDIRDGLEGGYIGERLQFTKGFSRVVSILNDGQKCKRVNLRCGEKYKIST